MHEQQNGRADTNSEGVTELYFPRGFYWGAATSAYQVEGNIDNTDWAKAAREGKVPVAGRSSDHYCRYEADFDIVKELGHNAHRLSVSWARIEPEEGKFDQEAVAHYRKVLTALRERGIEPFVTLWHFTLPLWFAQSGGFERRDAPEIFARYCAFTAKELGDLCTHFATLNEPNVYATHGYLYGAWPPFKRVRIFWKQIGKEDGTSQKTGAEAKFTHLFRYFQVVRTLTMAHKRAYAAIKQETPGAIVSVVKHVHYFHGHGGWWNQMRAKIMTYFQTLKYLNNIVDWCDEIGLNYYRNTGYGERKEYQMTDMGWKIAPEYIYNALLLLKRYNKPVVVMEAGLADADDDVRADYIIRQVRATHRAIVAGVDVRGHMYWSLLDNYEWALGYEKRFGLVAVDYETLERKIRPSAWMYKKICEENKVVVR